MAGTENTATPRPTTSGPAARMAYRRADEAAGRMCQTIPVAIALADALKVLSALERTTSHTEPDGMTTGGRYAGGHAVVDATMPDLASHLRDLLEQVQRDRYVLCGLFDVFVADAPAKEASHG